MGAPKPTTTQWRSVEQKAAVIETDNGDITSPLRKLYRAYKQKSAWAFLCGADKAGAYYQQAADRVFLLIDDDEPAFAQ